MREKCGACVTAHLTRAAVSLVTQRFGDGEGNRTFCVLPLTLPRSVVGGGSLTFTYCGYIVGHVSLSVCNLH